MRHPVSVARARSVRRSQRPSQRSADSKLTTQTGDSKLTTHTSDSKLTADSRATDSTSHSDPERLEDHGDKEGVGVRPRGNKRSGPGEPEHPPKTSTSQFLEAPKLSQGDEPPIALPSPTETEHIPRLSAKERWLNMAK